MLISKTSTTLPTRKNGWGARINEGKGVFTPSVLSLCGLRSGVENKILLLT